MNYCTIADIETLLGFPEDTYTTESRPTKAIVEREIEQVTNEIDFALLSIGIESQPTDSRFLSVLRSQCAYGVACRIGISAFGNNTSIDGSQPSYYCTKYDAFILDIQDNPEKYGVVSGEETSYYSNNIVDGTKTEAEQTEIYLDLDYEA